MKTFEEKWTAWIDGQLDEKELADFKGTLPDLKTAEMEKEQALKLGNFLRQELGLPKMENEEFFHHQLRTEMARDLPQPALRENSEPRTSWWSVGRVAWAAVASLALLAICTLFVMQEENVGGQSTYLTQIINARVDPEVSPNATISIFETNEDKVTVLWVEGLQSLPSEYAAQ